MDDNNQKKPYIVWIVISLVILVAMGLIFLVSIKQVSKINLYVDQITDGKLVFDPYGGDSLELNVKDQAKITLNYEPDKKLVFTKCSYNKDIIDYKNRTITAKKTGKTKLICEVIFNKKTKSNPISITVK